MKKRKHKSAYNRVLKLKNPPLFSWITESKKVMLIKKIFLKLFFKLGIYQVVHFLSRHKITILDIHGIIDDTAFKPSQSLHIQHTKQALGITLEVLSKKYTFISLTTAVDILKNHALRWVMPS